MTKFLIAVASLLAALPVAAQSPSAYERMAEERFKSADANKDGKLTKAEAKDGMPRIHANFDRLDTAKRGYLTLAQVKAAIAAATR